MVLEPAAEKGYEFMLSATEGLRAFRISLQFKSCMLFGFGGLRVLGCGCFMALRCLKPVAQSSKTLADPRGVTVNSLALAY